MLSKSTNRTTSETRRPFAFQDRLIEPGTLERFEVPVARLPHGTWSYMPVVILHGTAAGPTIWLDAAIHGDELNGVAIIRSLIETIDPRRLAGTVIAVPIVNVFGVTHGSRYLPDRRDLNRCFPGSRRGSLASRLAHLFFDTVARRCEVGIDIHTGSGGRSNLPQIRCDVDDPRALRLAQAFGVPVILHTNLRDGSLRAAAVKHDIPVLVYEAGEALRFGRREVSHGTEGSLRVMAALGMLDRAPESEYEAPVVSRKSTWLRAKRSGFCQVHVRLGAVVEKDEPVASILDTVGKSEIHLRAKARGVVIAALKTALVHRGDAIMHIAELAPDADVRGAMAPGLADE